MLSKTPITFEQALAVAREKGLLPTRMTSEQLRQLEAGVRRRAVFSAQMDREQVLKVLKRELELIVSGDTDEYGRIRSIPEAKARLKEAMRAAGVPPAGPDTPDLMDFYSDKRRQLIVETSVQDTLNYGRWKATQDSVILDENPAWELVRMVEPLTKGRDWPTRWDSALRSIGDTRGATAGLSGRLVALKNHPIWQALGDGAGGYRDTLGNPWPPFAFNSGMNVIDVSREEAESLGLIQPHERILPEDEPAANERRARADGIRVAVNALLRRAAA